MNSKIYKVIFRYITIRYTLFSPCTSLRLPHNIYIVQQLFILFIMLLNYNRSCIYLDYYNAKKQFPNWFMFTDNDYHMDRYTCESACRSVNELQMCVEYAEAVANAPRH